MNAAGSALCHQATEVSENGVMCIETAVWRCMLKGVVWAMCMHAWISFEVTEHPPSQFEPSVPAAFRGGNVFFIGDAG